MNKTEEVAGQERVILWKDIKANDPEVAALLRQDFRELVDMLTGEMVGKAAGYMLEMPDYPEDYRTEEIADFECGKEKFRHSTNADVNGGSEKSLSLIRAELRLMAEIHERCAAGRGD